MAEGPPTRLAYIDWMRGLACVLMFQTHCYDAWLSPAARKSRFFMWSQLLGTFPAPLFLFLAGISFALVTEKLRQRGSRPNEIAAITIRRGAEILGLGLLFRLQEYLIAFPWAPWTDLLRVDILNTIGVSMMMMGVVVWIGAILTSRMQAAKWRSAGLSSIASAVLVAAAIAVATPLVWTVARPDWLPWPLQSYLDGVHNLGQPQSWLFPIFPWSAFAFTGLAVGFVLSSVQIKAHEVLAFFLLAGLGILLVVGGKWLDSRPQIYPVYNFWLTSPNFFLMRAGILLVILLSAYCWCRWGPVRFAFSPLVQLGQTSLLVYWVHIEFVYGRVSILRKHAMGVGGASAGLLIICLSMLALSRIRTQTKRRASQKWFWRRMPARADAQKIGQ